MKLRRPLLLPLILGVGSLLACSTVDIGRKINKVIPAIREIDSEYDTEPVECDPPFPMARPHGCAQEEITCGSIVEGNSGETGSNFDDDFYQHHMCTPERNQYDQSPEAVYLLSLPPDVLATLTLVSDCADLDLASYRWEGSGKCPTARHNRAQCEMDISDRGGSIDIATVNTGEHHLIIIDGKKGAEGNFRLQVKCRTYR
jgi:hypothetical protein